MSSNNYFGFPHGGAQYGQPGSYQTAQTGYAVTPATYTTQRSAYETAYTPAATNSAPATAYATSYGVSAGAGAAAGTYEYGYARPAAATYQTPVAATYSTADYSQQGGDASDPASASSSTNPLEQAVNDYEAYLEGLSKGKDHNSEEAATEGGSPKTGMMPEGAKPAYSANAYATTTARQVPLTTQPKQVAYTSNTVSYPTQAPQPVAATYSTTYVNTQQPPVQQVKQEKKPVAKYIVPTAASSTYTPSPSQHYNAGFSASTIQATAPLQTGMQGASWASYKKQPFLPHNPNQGGGARRPRPTGKPQQIHYCDVCKISCGGIMTYKEHLDGQKHKKKEAAAKSGAGAGGSSTNTSRHPNSSLMCELCEVACTGADAYAAHIRGAKHQKVVKLHTKLGKPIPVVEPVKKEVKAAAAVSTPVAPSAASSAASAPANANADSAEPTDMDTVEPEVEPVGMDYLEEIRTDDGKVVFNCKLCDCKFNDPNAREMHMKGRRHRLAYKKKVDPSLVVDVKVNARAKKQHEDRMKRMMQREDYFRQQSQEWGYPMGPMMPRPFDGPMPGPMGPMMGPFFPGMRRPPTSDDRHVMARHTAIYPKPEELDAVHKIIAHNEKALKLVSDQLSEEAEKKAAAKTGVKPAAKADNPAEEKKVESGEQSMLSFQQGGEVAGRVLKGAMRVGNLAKGLLLTGDTSVSLVVICGEKPTKTLISRVAEILPKQLEVAAPDETYKTLKKPDDACIVVMNVKEPHYTATITFTSPLMRDPPPDVAAADGVTRPAAKDPADVLDKQKCLDALAALRHAKWFQARAKSMQSCVMTIRIFRDLCQRVPTWAPLNSWATELLIEKVLSSAAGPLSLGEAMRRVMEAVSAGVLLPNGPGLMDPCEKEPTDAVGQMTNQQREDVTASAQQALRLIAFRQMHKVLGMDMLPPPKGFRFQRKRRLEGGQTDTTEGGADGKKAMITDA